MLRILPLLLLPFASNAVAAPLLYRVTDTDSTLWLLGSVHALRASDYPLDERIESAYRDAERIVLEVAPAELDPSRIAGVVLPLARYQGDAHLADAFTGEEYARLRSAMREIGVDIAQFRDYEPWFVALQVFALNLARSGYAGTEGVDLHFGTRAAADGKQTAGLETAAEQFGMFDSLPLETQKTFLLDSVAESGAFHDEMEAIVSAWRSGDDGALTRLLEKEFGDKPELRDTLLDARNRRWAESIESLLAAPGDTMLVVGALHLVGDTGLVTLLEQAGYTVERVE